MVSLEVLETSGVKHHHLAGNNSPGSGSRDFQRADQSEGGKDRFTVTPAVGANS